MRKDGRWFKPTGTTATTHILKPQIGQLPNGIDLSNSVENEYLCLKLLGAFGVPAANVEIAEFGGRRTLIIERFDRLWTRDGRLLRLPQEDTCQALSIAPTKKYQSDGGPGMVEIINLLKGSDTPDTDIATFMRANIIFWILGATDGHAKNFSVFLGPGGRFRMTPLYDVLTAQPSLDADQILRKTWRPSSTEQSCWQIQIQRSPVSETEFPPARCHSWLGGCFSATNALVLKGCTETGSSTCPYRRPARNHAVGTVPPSMTYSVPVIDAARGETRKVMRSATSCGLAGRPSGMPPRESMMIFLPPS